MTGLARKPEKLTVKDFVRFYDTRPDEERWQLVDGVALLMTPPLLTHQVIASTLQEVLNAGLRRIGAQRRAYQRIGIELLPAFPHYRPEPDVAVIDIDIPSNKRHVERFYLAAEVLSDSDDERIELKRGLYRAHSHNQAILLIRQDRQEVELDFRRGEDWAAEILRGPDAVLSLPDFGVTCSLSELYRDTPVPDR